MNAIKELVRKITALYAKLEDYFMVYSMLLSGVMILYDVAVRAVGMTSFSWISEFSRYAYVLTVFIGSSKAMRAGSHMVMDLLHQLFPAKASLLLQAVEYVALGMFSWYLCYFSFQWTMRLKALGRSVETLPNFQLWIIWAVVTAALATTGIRAWARSVELFIKSREIKKVGIQQDIEL